MKRTTPSRTWNFFFCFEKSPDLKRKDLELSHDGHPSLAWTLDFSFCSCDSYSAVQVFQSGPRPHLCREQEYFILWPASSVNPFDSMHLQLNRSAESWKHKQFPHERFKHNFLSPFLPLIGFPHDFHSPGTSISFSTVSSRLFVRSGGPPLAPTRS